MRLISGGTKWTPPDFPDVGLSFRNVRIFCVLDVNSGMVDRASNQDEFTVSVSGCLIK